jgi:hypothetical protein
MPRLQHLVGQTILAKVPFLQPDEWQQFMLHDVEISGIWVESQHFTDWLLGQGNVPAFPKTFLVFLPFAQIQAIVAGSEHLDQTALSEKAFGL